MNRDYQTSGECRNCGGENWSLTIDTQVTANVGDGRLKANEVRAIIVLGCVDCSETLDIFTQTETLPMSILPHLITRESA